MIAYSIDAAKVSGCFERVIVSTDDEIGTIAKQHGTEVPFTLPSQFADDHVTTASVIEFTLNHYESNNKKIDYDPTAPLISSEEIPVCFNKLVTSVDANFCFPDCSFSYQIQRALRLDPNQRVQMFQPKDLKTHSQDLEEGYHDTKLFYLGRAQAFLDGLPVFSTQSIPLILPRYRVVEINTPEDWDTGLKLYNVFKDAH
ncbi:acylneuraminate cytidylyltransferase family protein [Vibrio breoganii]|uniref:acylneuraminate cytidylyltransferase family protein n=1 Tax=Vibrio breoganii TaxID=553239 RepID=UPI001F53B9AE|nr:acylneuraminate cytidylyltransferase family protein [Vibrio breoganii]